MVIDYRERKNVSKNRPRRQPAGIFVFSIFVAVIIAYTLGLVTGWVVFRTGKGSVADGQNQVSEPGKIDGAQPAAKAPPSEINNGPVKEPMLTFYETLPKGNRELIGSGLNLPKSPEAPVPAPLPAQKPVASPQKTAPAVKETPAVPAAETGAKAKETARPQDKTGSGKAKEPASPKEAATVKETTAREETGKQRFAVQVASYQDKNEAEELRDRLKTTGISAYIVESTIAGKGTYYRIRAGRHLDQKGAQELADKIGKGAMLVPE